MSFRRGPGRPPHPDVLTPAEWRVLEEVRAGRTNAEIATVLGLSPNTVKTHLSRIMDKLDVRDRAELAAWQGKPVEASRSAFRRLHLPASFASLWRLAALAAVGAVSLGGVFLLLTGGQLREGAEPAPSPSVTSTAAPTPTRPAATTTPTSTSTSVPTSTPVPAATVASQPPPPSSTPWTVADYLDVLALWDYEVAPTGTTVACGQVGGLPGIEYGGDLNFVIWEYPDPAAVAEEWYVRDEPSGDRLTTHHREFECNRAPAYIYYRENLVVWASGADDASGWDVGVFLVGLGFDSQYGTDDYPYLLLPPAEGTPFSGQDLMEALAADGLVYVPYDSITSGMCLIGPERGLGAHYMAPYPRDGWRTPFALWVYPTVETLEEEWVVGEDGMMGEPGVHALRSAACEWEGPVYLRGNVALFPDGAVDDGLLTRILGALWSLAP